MKRNIKYLLIILVTGCFFIFLFNPDLEKRCFKVLEKEKKDEVIGVVINKYYVKKSMYPYLEIRCSSDSSIAKKSFHAELSGIFNYAEIGDSIYKPEESLVYTIIKGKIVKQLKFTMFCNE